MAAYYGNSQNLVNKFPIIQMEATVETGSLDLCNASPPDFDFDLPCRFFKSSFARSLSLNNASSQCKSLDYDMRSNNSNSNNNSNGNNNYNKTSFLKRETKVVPPIPQRRASQAGIFYSQPATVNEANKNEITSSNEAEDQPPALPARRPLSLHNTTQLGHNVSVKPHSYINNTNDQCQLNAEQKPKNALLTQLRPQQYTTNNSNNNSYNNSNKNNNKNIIIQATGLQAQKQSLHIHHHHPQQTEYQMQFPTDTNDDCNTHTNSSSNSGNSVCVNNNNTSNTNDNNNFRSNNIVWPPQQQKNVEQDCNVCKNDHTDEDDNNGIDLISNYRDTTKLSSNNDYVSHFPNSHQMITATMIPTINVHNNQQQQQQQQQQHQQHQLPSYNEILNDNTTNVEAVILQNQVDTLQWQLKQVETSCDMYRAVMEEVARFLERYQSQKQLQQQQQQQQQQQKHQEYQLQQTVAVHKQKNNNNKVEQIPRSKSLFQVYIAGGHDKSTSGGCGGGSNSALDETTSSYSPTASSSSLSYLRARSSTNLIDLKHQQNVDDTSSNKKKLIGHSKDDHDYETGLKPSQSYSTLKDLTWRRSPKKADLRLNTEDDLEEKLNQEAFRLLRTIQNLLNTSHHQPDLAQHRHSLAPSTTVNIGRLAKTMSTTSVLTLPGAPLLNSTSLTIGSNSTGSCTPDSAAASPSSTAIAHNTASNNLAPEMLFLRSANMRDSRLSLRSSTDSSVHSTSSAASSASSKVETDEEPSTIFRSPPNILAHKQQHHLTGSSTEDESGFSSINSFPDIGVPLNSTMLSSSASSNKGRIPNKELNSQINDSCNSTLKANVVGLPLNISQDMSHRWDPPSKTYHNASSKFQRFSALTKEDSNTVLWV